MILAFWCVLIVGLLPYFTAAPAKATKTYDNAAPRDWAARQTGFRARAMAAHANGFEAFPLFAVAVLVAFANGAPHDAIDSLAVIYVVLRLLYVACYYAGWALVRSIVWIAALGVAVAIFCLPVMFG